MMLSPRDDREMREVEFFGLRLKVNNPKLAALLNSGVTEDVVVIGRRALSVIRTEEEPVAGRQGTSAPEELGPQPARESA